MAVGVELGHHNRQLSTHAELGEMAKLPILTSIAVTNKRQHADEVAPGTGLALANQKGNESVQRFVIR